VNRDIRLTLTYFLGATMLTVLIVFQNQRGDKEIAAAVVEAVEVEISVLSDDLSEAFCETINDMHRVRGFEVIDCKANTVRVKPYRRDEDGE
jgi:hypothetical protein